MKRIFYFSGILVLFMAAAIKNEDGDTIFYVSLNKAIHLGQFDGVITVRELKTHGNFGVGSEENLAGELILLDGVAYTIPANGKASVLPEEAEVAYAAVKFFKADKKIAFSHRMDLKALEYHLDSLITDNTFAAIRITGQLEDIKYRSFEKQEKPYKTISLIHEVKMDKKNVQATLAGFYTPTAASVLNSPEYHFHFIDAEKSTGGHVNDCILLNAQIEIDYASDLKINLPEAAQMQHIDLDK